MHRGFAVFLLCALTTLFPAFADAVLSADHHSSKAHQQTLTQLRELESVNPTAIAAKIYLPEDFEQAFINKQVEYLAHPEASFIVPSGTDEWRSWNEQIINFGFDKRSHWLRLRVVNLQAQAVEGLLELCFPNLDHVDIYAFDASGQQEKARTIGDSYSFNSREIKHQNFLFHYTFPADSETIIYLHIQGDGLKLVPMKLMTGKALFESQVLENYYAGLYFGLLISIALASLVAGGITQRPSFFMLSLFVSAWIAILATFSGLSFRVFWPELPKLQVLSFAYTLVIGVMATGALANSVLRPKPSEWLFVFCKRLWQFSWVLLLILMFLPMAVAYTLVAAYIFLSQFGLCIGALSGMRQKRMNSGLFMVAWSLIMVGGAYVTLIALGYTGFSILPVQFLVIVCMPNVMLLVTAVIREHVHYQNRKLVLYSRKQERMNLASQYQQKQLSLQEETQEELERQIQERTWELEITLRELEEKNQELEAINMTDELTRVHNRRYFDKRFTSEFRRSWRSDSPLSLIMADIDHFKLINDTHGHLAGDAVLKQVAMLLKHVIKRPSDAVCRYGGEEFAIILPASDAEGAYQLAEEIRESIESHAFDIECETLSVTMSFGVYGAVGNPDLRPDTYIRFADEALYEAKKNGRNQVIQYQTPELSE